MLSHPANPANRSYLLRIWSDDADSARWSCSLEDAHTGARRGFANLDELFAYVIEASRAPRQAPRAADEAGQEPAS
jgi:hypothetical protein